MHAQSVYIVAVGLDNMVSQPVLCAQDHRQLGASVEPSRSDVWVVQLL